MATNQYPGPAKPRTVPLLALFSLQVVVLAVYVAAPIIDVAWVAWTAAVIMAFVWLFQWAAWMVARRNLALMPCFGVDSIDTSGVSEWPGVALIAAARNEEAGLEPAARSMAATAYPAFELIVVDDHSTDATPEILDRLARELPRLRVLHDPPPQPGWMGKQNALWHAVQQAGSDCQWLLFTDADIAFGPAVVKDAVAFMEHERLDFMTCMPYLEIDSLAEELVLVSGWLRHLDWCQYQKLNEPKSRGLGIGAFMLVRRSVYEAAGGHAAIAGDPCDDAALAIHLKRNGARMGFGWASDQLRCHQYHGYKDMMCNLVRKQRISFQDRLPSFACVISYQLIQWVLPPLMAVTGVAAQVVRHEFSPALTAYSVMAGLIYVQGTLGYALGRWFCAMRLGTPYLHPVAGVLRIWIGLHAVARALTRKPLDWRGRDVSPAWRQARPGAS